MKQCSRCKQEKPLSAFSKNSSRKDGLQRNCKQCKKNIDNSHFEKKGIEVIKKETRKRSLSRREWINEIKKQHSCVKCGDDRYYVLDFHHVDPSLKSFTIASNSNGKAKILEEIEKCVTLCSSCHREFHHLERTENITIEKYAPIAQR